MKQGRARYLALVLYSVFGIWVGTCLIGWSLLQAIMAMAPFTLFFLIEGLLLAPIDEPDR
jgi:hypothetical protein